MTPEIKAAIDGINSEWAQMRALLEGKFATETKAYGDALGETKAAVDAFNARIDALEVKLARPASPGAAVLGHDGEVDPKAAEKKAAFNKFLRKGDMSGIIEHKLMIVSDDSTGGVAAPAEFDMNIIKSVTNISMVRQYVRVRNTGNRSVKVMKRTGQFAAVWVGEVSTRSETTGLTYGMEEIPTHEIYALVDISKQDLEDTNFDLEGELKSEFAEQFALAEGAAVVNGVGVGKPEGFMQNAAVAGTDKTTDANLLTYDGFVNVSHNIKEAYLSGSQFYFNLKTLGAARKLKDTTNQPIWAPMQADSPSTILGFKYASLPDMPDVSAAAFPVGFGDLRKAYQLVDRVNTEIERDPYTQNTRGVVRFIARKRIGGQVVLAEAFRKLLVSA